MGSSSEGPGSMKCHQKGLLDLEIRFRDINEKDPLARLNEVINWEAFRASIEQAIIPEVKGPGGRLRFDSIQMFKTLVLRRLYHLSDGQTEFMIRDRLSFMRFVGVDLHEPIPDEKTTWRYRELKTKGTDCSVCSPCPAALKMFLVSPQHFVDQSLILPALLLEPLNDIGVQSDRYRLLFPNQLFRRR